jgi:hypothetical protein
MDGKKTLIGAILIGITSALNHAETTGVVPPGTNGAVTSVAEGFGFFLAIFGIGSKLEKMLNK